MTKPPYCAVSHATLMQPRRFDVLSFFIIILFMITPAHIQGVYAPLSSIPNDKFTGCIGVQSSFLSASIIITKMYVINKDRTSNLLGCISVACDTAHNGGSVTVCVLCIWQKNVISLKTCYFNRNIF